MTADIVPKDTILELQHLSPLICTELAAGLSDPKSVCKRYNITPAQWERLKVNPAFIGMMKEAEVAFSGDANAGKRITKKAEILLEESLVILHRLMTRPDASPHTILDTVKQLTVLAGRMQKPTENISAQGGFNVAIHINTGDGEARIEKNSVIEHPLP